jgi:hypothetical protein
MTTKKLFSFCAALLVAAAGFAEPVRLGDTNTYYELYGSVSGAESRFYTSGETVTLVATPKDGYNFINWTTTDGARKDGARRDGACPVSTTNCHYQCRPFAERDLFGAYRQQNNKINKTLNSFL